MDRKWKVGLPLSFKARDGAISHADEMLRAEAAGAAYNKSEHNHALRRELNGRSKSSVELKYQNISAVLDALGLPYINGYKPRGNSQLLLRKSVQACVLKHQQAVGAIVDALAEVKLPSEKTYLAALVEGPKREAFVPSPAKAVTALSAFHLKRLCIPSIRLNN
jgi:hypothetical protein